MFISIAASGVLLLLAAPLFAAEAGIKDLDNRFEPALFAEQPQIVHPIGIQVDDRGRVYVIESHTHFRPKEYDGPAADRILLLEDADGNSRADKTTVFHEGFVHAMDLLLADDRSLYVATRSAIHRLRDKDGDGRADEDVKLIDLQTKGDYPHNGLSGLAFDGDGGLYFGFGENLGEAYKLIGTDGSTLTGEAEGGNIYHCRLDGSALRQVATGVWNPFGLCLDASGNLFATDNDPDSSPPCRLLHVVEGGDYGYEFRYGRSGLHVFQAWNGEFPGTLPMVTGTGEAPCKIVGYADGLLVASWADNRLEHYRLVPHGASFGAEQRILISGDLSFRPVGIAVAKDGTLYVSDWGTGSYELSKLGRIWKFRPRQPAAAGNVATPPAIAAEPPESLDQLYRLVKSDDPFVRSRAINALAQVLPRDKFTAGADAFAGLDDDQAVALVLAGRKQDLAAAPSEFLRSCLAHRNERVKLLGLKWIADQKLTEFRDAIEQGLHDPKLTTDLFAAHLAALERMDGKKIGERPNPELLLPLLRSTAAAPQVRALALHMLPADDKRITASLLKNLIEQPGEALQLAVLRTIAAAPVSDELKAMARTVVADTRRPVSLRAEAVSALAGDAASKEQLLALALGPDQVLRDEALRSLVETPLTDDEQARLSELASLPEVARLLGKKSEAPSAAEIEAWLSRAPREGDPEAGRRIFFHSKVGYCSRCHQHEGRGSHIGPALSAVSQRGDRQWLLTAILQPARDVAPAFRQWQIQLADGTQRVGISLRKGGNSEDYYGADGKVFRVKIAEIEARGEVATSLMPEGLAGLLTPQELSDLLAFLMQRPLHDNAGRGDK